MLSLESVEQVNTSLVVEEKMFMLINLDEEANIA